MTLNNFLSSDVKDDIKPKPFVKWVGGKRSIMTELLKHIPKDIKNYYEPFVGGGALFFEIYNMVNFSYLSDLNVDLIITYNVIKGNSEDLIKRLKKYQIKHNKEYYYYIRSMQALEDPINNSAGSVASVESEFRIWYKGGKKLAQCHFIFPPNYSSISKDFALRQRSSCSLYI